MTKSSNLLPTTREPLGYVTVKMPDGSTQRLPIEMETKWYLFFDELARKVL